MLSELLNLGALEIIFDLTYALVPVDSLSVVVVLFSWLVLVLVLVLVGLLVAFLALYCKLPAFVAIWLILSQPVLVSRIRCFLALSPRVFLLAFAVVPFVLDLMTLVLLALAAS